MSNLKKDLEEISLFLQSKSPLGAFAREKEPEYEILKKDCEVTGRCLAKAQYVAQMREIEHKFAVLKLQSFVSAVPLDDSLVEEVKEQISNFTTDYMKGLYN